MKNTRSSTMRVFIVDDSVPVRQRIAQLLDAIEGVAVVGEAETPAQAIEGIFNFHPDVVLLDIHLIAGSGLDVLQKVHPQSPGIVFVVLTNHPSPQYRKAYLDAGARYFLDKSTEIAEIAEIIATLDVTRH